MLQVTPRSPVLSHAAQGALRGCDWALLPVREEMMEENKRGRHWLPIVPVLPLLPRLSPRSRLAPAAEPEGGQLQVGCC